MLVRRAEMLQLECIVRGYLAGQAWEEYERSGTVHGMAMPEGLLLASKLEKPMFTPSTKAAEGHDLNIDFAEAVDLVGAEAVLAARAVCLELYRRAAARCADAGFDPGRHQVRAGLRRRRAQPVRRGVHARLLAAVARRCRSCPGTTPPAFDKQPLRDWLAQQPWDRTPPPPALPDEVVGGHVGALRRGLRARHRPLAERLVRCLVMRSR